MRYPDRVRFVVALILTGCGQASSPDPFCGDGAVDPGEACDLGVDNDDHGACKTDCTGARCGDGFAGPGEDCDDGNAVDDDACTNVCAPPECGDGIVQAGEACDDGDAVDDDACTNRCALATCGDGLVQEGEDCDDADADDSDACIHTCLTAECGDGHVRAGVEECDDANFEDFDGCMTDCTVARMILGTCDETGAFVAIEGGETLTLGDAADQPARHFEVCIRERGLLRDPPMRFAYRVVDDLGVEWAGFGPGEYVRPEGDDGWLPEAEAWFELRERRAFIPLTPPEDLEGLLFTITGRLIEDDGDVFEDVRSVYAFAPF